MSDVRERFRQNFWMVKALGVSLAGALAGSAVMTTLATRALLDITGTPTEAAADEADAPTTPPTTARASSDDDAQRRRRAEQAATDILGYNPFCPGCEPEVPTAAPTPAVAIADAPVAAVALQLVATMESSDPTASLATLYDPRRGITGLYGVGDRLGSTATLERVGNGVVAIRTPDGVTELQLGGPTPPVRVAAATDPRAPTHPRATAVARPAAPTLPGAAEAISCTGADTCVVDRAFVDSIMNDPAVLATQAAVRPTAEGFALTRVRAGSLPALLGLQRGDVITEVNGQALGSVDQVLTMATKLRRASTLEVTLLRGGKSVRKEIQIS